MRYLVLLTLCALGLLAVLAGRCALQPTRIGAAPPPASPVGLPQGHVYTGIADEPDDVNPFTSHGATVRRYVVGLCYEGLLETDPVDGSLRTALAEHYEVTASPPSCTFTLREGVQFASGATVAMQDVLFGWELAQAGHLPLGFVADAYSRVASAEALDGRRLRLTFRSAQPGVLRTVAENWVVAQRSFFVDATAALAARQGKPAPAVDTAEFAALLRQLPWLLGPGTGPFQLPGDLDGAPTWQRKQELLLLRHEGHWRRTAQPGCWNLGGVRLLFRDRSVAANELFAHRVDWYFEPDCDGLLARRPDLQPHYRTLVYDHPAQGLVTVQWNCRRQPLDDPRVRQALGHLWDREAMVQLYHGKAAPAVALTKPTAPDHPAGLQPLSFDPPRARALLREAGYGPELGRPLTLTMLAASGNPQLAAVVALLLDAARAAAIDLQVRELEFTGFVAQKAQGDWDALLALRSLRPFGDPYDFVHSRGTDNDGGWQHAEADRLAELVREELDEARRLEHLRKLHALVHEQQPLALLVHPQVAILFRKQIESAVPGPRGLWPERFWVPREWQRE